jgi:hypothetical protein
MIYHYSMDLDIRIFFFYHKPQLVIKIFLTLKIGCSVHEFILLLNLLDICASYFCLVTTEQDVQ